MKQAAVAREIGVGQSMVSRWRRGESVPSSANCKRLARLFGESEQVVLALAGHLSEANAPAPERSLTDLVAELAERIRELEATTASPAALARQGSERSTPVAFRQHQPAGSMERARPDPSSPRAADAEAGSADVLLALLCEWGSTMPEADYVIVTIHGDYLLPAVVDGEQLILSLSRQARPGNRVLVRLNDRIVTGRIRIDGGIRLLAVDGGPTIPLDNLTIVALIVGRAVDEGTRDD